MSVNDSAEVQNMARRWAGLVNDPSFADWDEFSSWLEADPAHLEAYEAALATELWIDSLFASEQHDLLAEPAPPPRRRRAIWAGGMAAAVAAAMGIWAISPPGTSSRQIATGPGEHRTIALADGSRIVMNGGTRIALEQDNPRGVELVSGEALFEVRHDDAQPFIVSTGDVRLIDMGTVFNVVEDDGALDVAVAEGAVKYETPSREIHLNAGDGLSRASAAAAPVVRKASPSTIGGWRTGHLQYDNVSLNQVARDLGRNLGRPVQTVGGVSEMRFTGSLIVSGPPAEVLERAGPLLGVRFTLQDGKWIMAPANVSAP